MKRLALVLLLLILVPTFAVAADQDMAAAAKRYLAVQEALAGDELDAAKKDAKGLADEHKAYAEAAGRVAGAKTIDEAREAFKGLSIPFVTWVQNERPKDLVAYHCSMASADWVQAKAAGGPRNPYYGKAMLGCGVERKPRK